MPNPANLYTPPQFPQTTVNYFPNVGLNGQLADTGHHDITTAVAESPGFDVGLAIVLGAGGYGYGRLPAASGDIASVIGFSLYEAMREPSIPRFLPFVAVDILRKGRIWITAQGITVDNGPVFIIYSGANAGQLRGDAGSGGNAALQLTRATVRQGSAAGGMSLVEVNLP